MRVVFDVIVDFVSFSFLVTEFCDGFSCWFKSFSIKPRLLQSGLLSLLFVCFSRGESHISCVCCVLFSRAFDILSNINGDIFPVCVLFLVSITFSDFVFGHHSSGGYDVL